MCADQVHIKCTHYKIIGFRLNTKDDLRNGSHSLPHILLAEGDEANRKVTLHMLKRLGYAVEAVSNGVEALEALEHGSYDMVIMNVRMRLMDGIEATKQIRRLWQNEQKIIALTAYNLPDIKEKCLAAGMDDYISKPVTLHELAKVLSKYQKIQSPRT